jgi:hypothetical protein
MTTTDSGFDQRAANFVADAVGTAAGCVLLHDPVCSPPGLHGLRNPAVFLNLTDGCLLGERHLGS